VIRSNRRAVGVENAMNRMSGMALRFWPLAPLAALTALAGCTAVLGDFSVVTEAVDVPDADVPDVATQADAAQLDATGPDSSSDSSSDSSPDSSVVDASDAAAAFDGNCGVTKVPVVTPGPMTGFCPGKTVTLTAPLSATYNWSSGATTRSIDVGASGVSGTYAVTTTDRNGCSATSAAVTVTAYPPAPNPTITTSGTLPCGGGGMMTLTASSASSYLWSTGQTTQSIDITTPGVYTVSTTDSNGCSADSSVNIPAVAHASMKFVNTGMAQTFTVPACVTSLTVDAAGAQGGVIVSPMTGTGGIGGRVQVTLAVTAGQVLQINVGGSGTLCSTSNVGGYNGGGTAICLADPYSGTGGGASDIRVSPYSLTNRIVVAGGGGGSGYDYTSMPTMDNGGAGGDLVGGQAYLSVNHDWAGYGGTQTAGGAGGSYIAGTNYGVGASGAFGVGGSGGGTCTGQSGGGGGGGYYGGGQGCWSGGGGGSSYVDATLGTSVTHTQGYQSGDGYVSLSW
jgi:hypothetical protein